MDTETHPISGLLHCEMNPSYVTVFVRPRKNSLCWQSVQSNPFYVAKYQSDLSVLYHNIQHKIIVEKIMTHASKTYTMIQ